ncbi:MAG TPA: hypothetical protein VJ787_01795 [Thermoleophilia bacterium]|nr:hypothetical protein [Thermoleophilia bacterium]
MATTLIESCADGRLRELLPALETRLGVADSDRLLVPGGPLALVRDQRERGVVLEWLDRLVDGHDIELVCLVSHEDYLAYSTRLMGIADGERKVLERDLASAERLIEDRYPSLRVECFVVPRELGRRPGRLASPERVAL